MSFSRVCLWQKQQVRNFEKLKERWWSIVFKKSEWLSNYGLIPKVILVLLIFIGLGGLNIFASIFYAPDNRIYRNYKPYNTGHLSKEFRQDKAAMQEWQKKHDQLKPIVDQIKANAFALGDDYNQVKYFEDYNNIMDLEEQYEIDLSNGLRSLLHSLHNLSVQAEHNSWDRDDPLTEAEKNFIKTVQNRAENRDKKYIEINDISKYGVLWWLIKSYLLLMLFWALIYIIRFEENDKATEKIKKYDWALSRFIEVEEKMSGTLSFYDEILICPLRFFSRLLFWPLFCTYYPLHESPAEMIRYLRLKARYLQFKPIGYQLTAKEEALLKARASRSIADFDQAIKQLFVIDTKTLVKRSIAAAYLSLLIGVYLQPIIVFAAKHADKIDANFYSAQIECCWQADQPDENLGNDPPIFADQNIIWQAIADKKLIDIAEVIIYLAVLQIFLRLKMLFQRIDHIPKILVLDAA